MFTYTSPYALGDRVYVGEDKAIIARVIGVLWSAEDPDIKVTYVHSGTVHSLWVNQRMVSRVPEDE